MTPLAMNNPGRRWVSVATAAKYLSLSLGTCYEKLYRKEIPGARIGRTWRVDLKALDALLEGKEKPR